MGQVANGPSHIALAVTADGERDILGLRTGDGGEDAKFWLHVLTSSLHNGPIFTAPTAPARPVSRSPPPTA